MERVVTLSSAAMVLEQDFILQIRRLQRAATAHWVLNMRLAALAPEGLAPDLLEQVQDHMNNAARQAGGHAHQMTNGDVFVVLPKTVTAEPQAYAAALLAAVAPASLAGAADPAGLVRVFGMPDDYMALRECVNDYIAAAKQLASARRDDPARNLRSAAVKGPLNAYALSQVERLLDELDIARYHRAQTVMRRQPNGAWQPVYQENFVSTTEMQNEMFPQLDLRANGRMFAEMGAMIDRRMLAHMLGVADQWQGRAIGLNLAARTVLSSTFAQFCHVVNGAARPLVTFEVHISDLFHDMPMFTNALATLRSEGFRVVIDGLRPDMLPLLHLPALPVDGFKVSVRRELLPYLGQAQVLQALRALPAEKVILMHTEDASVLDIGGALEIAVFQGFYIDDAARAKAP